MVNRFETTLRILGTMLGLWTYGAVGYAADPPIDKSTAKVIYTTKKQIHGIAFAPMDRHMLVGEGVWTAPFTSGQLTLINLKDGNVTQLHGPTGKVCCVAYSPNGKVFAVGCEQILLYDVATCKVVAALQIDWPLVSCLAFSPNGSHLAAGSALNFAPGDKVRVWDVSSHKELFSCRGHDRIVLPNASTIHGVTFTKNGLQLVTVGSDDKVRVWDAATGKPLMTWNAKAEQITALGNSPDGKLLATGSKNGNLRLWDLHGKSPASLASEYKYDPPMISCLQFSGNGKWLATGDSYGNLKILDASTARISSEVELDTGAVTSIAFSHDGKTLAAATSVMDIKEDAAITIWKSND